MQTIVSKTFEEIAVGDTASVERTLQAGGVPVATRSGVTIDGLLAPHG